MDISPITIHKKAIDETLSQYLLKMQAESINDLQRDLIQRLIPFVTSGKSIRGCLAIFGFSLFSQKTNAQILDLAAALELLHSGLLIHDDIMDRDQMRRGKPSIYAQYEKLGNASDNTHFGISMGINAADFCFFSGYELLGNLNPDITKFVSGELQSVTAAQMQDVSASLTSQRLSEKDILSVYRYKTARYTFSLPLVIGAKLAGAPDKSLAALDKIGEEIGVMFQIRDDELNLLGNPNKTGKPVGGDIRELKQTLLSFYLSKSNPNTDLHTLSQQELTNMYIDGGSQKLVGQKLAELQGIVATEISTLAIDPEHKEVLQALAEFVQTREN